MSQVPLTHILFVSTALFFIGMYGLLTRRNLITMLMSVELILNSVNINFIAFNRYLYPGPAGRGLLYAVHRGNCGRGGGGGDCDHYQFIPEFHSSSMWNAAEEMKF